MGIMNLELLINPSKLGLFLKYVNQLTDGGGAGLFKSISEGKRHANGTLYQLTFTDVENVYMFGYGWAAYQLTK